MVGSASGVSRVVLLHEAVTVTGQLLVLSGLKMVIRRVIYWKW